MLAVESEKKPGSWLGSCFGIMAESLLAPGSAVLPGSASLLLELEAGITWEGLGAGPADVVAVGVVGATADAGAAEDVKTVWACGVVVGSGVRGPEAGCNTRGGSQSPDIPAVQVDHAGSKLYTVRGTDSNGLHGSYVIL